MARPGAVRQGWTTALIGFAPSHPDATEPRQRVGQADGSQRRVGPVSDVASERSSDLGV